MPYIIEFYSKDGEKITDIKSKITHVRDVGEFRVDTPGFTYTSVHEGKMMVGDTSIHFLPLTRCTHPMEIMEDFAIRFAFKHIGEQCVDIRVYKEFKL